MTSIRRNKVNGPVNAYGEVLSRIRRDHGLSQRELAKMLHISHVFLSNVERGANPPLTHDRAWQVLDTINATAEESAALLEFYCKHCGAKR